jgi:hypothetical protein
VSKIPDDSRQVKTLLDVKGSRMIGENLKFISFFSPFHIIKTAFL